MRACTRAREADGVFFSSSTVDGRRPARGTAVFAGTGVSTGSLIERVDEARDVLPEAVLRLRGICDGAATSESTLLLVVSVFSPSARPGSRLTTPNSFVSSLVAGGRLEVDASEAERGGVGSRVPVLNEPRRCGAGLKVEDEVVLGEVRGLTVVEEVPLRRGIFVGVCDFGGGVVERGDEPRRKIRGWSSTAAAPPCVEGEPAIVGRFALIESWSLLVRVRGVERTLLAVTGGFEGMLDDIDSTRRAVE